ncbi:hypothetical protein IWQ62_003138 [Dispira parvispora]|uniref:Uncharacterized protein n=1 Tax=Dispira parvispora TaxID=1520584 RepID=A0A9W8ARF6_9FUNG|nr:hypothetical protein IWQ62_003138 [Dispira parvispora]
MSEPTRLLPDQGPVTIKNKRPGTPDYERNASVDLDLETVGGDPTVTPLHTPPPPGFRGQLHKLRLRLHKTNWSHTFKILLLGQLLALCITSTTVCSNKLAQNYNVSIPTTQSLFNYVLLALVYVPFTIYRYGWAKWWQVLRRRGWVYFLFSVVDVEGNYFVVKAYQYTSLLSAMLLDTWAIPVVVLLSFLLLRMRFHKCQYLGVVICLVGMGLLVTADALMDRDYAGPDPLKGDLFCVLGATLYGISNVIQEFSVHEFPIYEVVAHLGLFGTIINGIQLAILERSEIASTQWSLAVIGYIALFDVSLFIMYSVTPLLIRMSSATFFNISLLTSDFYGLLFGLFLFHYRLHVLYPFAFAAIILGIIVYNLRPSPQPYVSDKVAKRFQLPQDSKGTADNTLRNSTECSA